MAESYTLREVAELLGVSKRTLQRRIREGAFPGRFLSPGRHGLETRIPAEDVRRVLEDVRRSEQSMVPMQVPSSVRDLRDDDEDDDDWNETLVPVGDARMVELEDLKGALVAAMAEERSRFLGEMKSALGERDAALAVIRSQLGAVLEGLDGIRRRLEVQAERPAEGPSHGKRRREDESVEAVLSDIEELERLVGAIQRN